MPRLRGPILIMLALLALVLLVWLPFLQQDLPRSNDGRLHLYRIIALDDAWMRDGNFYPRYASNLVYGYGASLFNYFPPVAYIPGVLMHRMGLSYTQAFQATMMGVLFIAAVGMHALASLTWPGDVRYKSNAGLGAAALYLYSPYLLFDAVGRGTLTEVVSLAVLPWVLWAMMRVANTINMQGEDGRGTENDGRSMLRPYRVSLKNLFKIYFRFLSQLGVFTGLLALFIPLHNVVTLHGGLLMGFVGLALLWQSPRRGRLLIVFLAAGIMAALMSVFFLVPALLEGNDVKIRAVTEALSFIDVTRTLRPLVDLFALPQTADPTNLQPNTPISYSWPALILALVALLGLWRTKSVRPLMIALMSLFVLTLLLMWQSPIGDWLWRTIPLLDYTQFAWRILGIASLALAWLGGWGIAALMQGLEARIKYEGKARLAPTVIAWIFILVVILLYGLSWTIARHEPIAAISILDAQAHERDSGELALSSYSEYLPTWVETPPEPERLQDAFASGQPVPRLQEAEGVTVQKAEWGGTYGVITFEAAQPTALVFDWLYMPGWIARFVNEEAQSLPVTVKPLSPHGLVSVEVPAGSYTLAIEWQETGLQRTSTFISLAGWGLWALGMIFVGIWHVRRARAQHAAPLQSNYDVSPLHVQPFITVIVVGIGIVLFKIAVIDTTQNLWRAERYANDLPPPVATFADKIFVREVVLEKNAVKAGTELPITIYWQVGQTPSRDESSLIELTNSADALATGGSFQPGGLAMTHWQPGTYVVEHVKLMIPADVPPGGYGLTLGLYDPVTQERRSVLNEAGNPQGVDVGLGNVLIRRADVPLTVTESRPVAKGVSFAGVKSPMPTDAVPGQEFVFDPRWVITGETTPTRMRLVWRECSGEGCEMLIETPTQCPPQADVCQLAGRVGGDYGLPVLRGVSLDDAQVGDVWRDVQTLNVPGNLNTGLHYVSLEVMDQDPGAGGQVLHLQTMMITAPDRTFVLPQDLKGQRFSWLNGIALQGYTGSLENFTLYWQTQAEVYTNLRLSVQIVDAAGQIVAQQDGIPVNWTRPVTGWAVGEVIATSYQFDPPGGEYQVQLVWYEPISGKRIEIMEEGVGVGDTAVIEME